MAWPNSTWLWGFAGALLGTFEDDEDCEATVSEFTVRLAGLGGGVVAWMLIGWAIAVESPTELEGTTVPPMVVEVGRMCRALGAAARLV